MRSPITHLLATKDRPDYLATALERAKTWVRSDDELLVIDGNVEPDKGLWDALNKGMARAAHDIVRIVNDDDWYMPESVDQAANVMADHPSIALLVCGGWRVWEPRPAYTPRGHAICVPSGTGYGSHPHTILDWGACGPGFFHRRELALPYSSEFNMADVDSALRHSAKGLDVRFLRVNLFTHVVYPHSTIGRDPDLIARERSRLQERYDYPDSTKRSYENPPVWDGEFA